MPVECDLDVVGPTGRVSFTGERSGDAAAVDNTAPRRRVAENAGSVCRIAKATPRRMTIMRLMSFHRRCAALRLQAEIADAFVAVTGIGDLCG